jgi:biotin operon repressor
VAVSAHAVDQEGTSVADTTLREIDQRIVEAVRRVGRVCSKVECGRPEPTRGKVCSCGSEDFHAPPVSLEYLVESLDITRDYLTARLRALRRGGALPADVSSRVPEGRKRVPDSDIITAWQKKATVSDVARGVGLSRAGVLQRVARLRVQGHTLRSRPHAFVPPEERQRLLREAIAAPADKSA